MLECQQTELKKFLARLTLFLAAVLILDFCAGGLLRFLYFRQMSGVLYRTTFAIERTTAPILVFGSSRANHHYHPDVLGSLLNMDCYNAGRDGQSILYHEAVLRCVLKRYTPKIVILDLNRTEFEPRDPAYSRLSALLPYYSTHPEIRPLVDLRGPFENAKMLSRVYPFNGMLMAIIMGNTDFRRTRRADIKGFMPGSGTWKGKPAPGVRAFSPQCDKRRVQALEFFVAACKQRGTRLFIVCSPHLGLPSAPSPALTQAEIIARRNRVAFLDYSEDERFRMQAEFFSDPSHLNVAGAKAFSAIVAERIRDDIRKSQDIEPPSGEF